MSRRILSVFLGLCLIVCTGCVHSVRLSKRAVVRAVGIDHKDGMYTAVMRLYGLEGGGPDTSSEIATAKGQTLTTLFEQASIKEGRQLFLGNLRLIVFGQGLVEEGTQEAISFISSYQQISPATQIAVAEGEAATLLGEQQSKLSVGKVLDTLVNAQKAGDAPVCLLMNFSDGTDRAVPLLGPILPEEPQSSSSQESSSSESGSSSGSSSGASGSSGESSQDSGTKEKPKLEGVLPKGAVIFSGGRGVEVLNPAMTRGYCWLAGKLKAAALETKTPLSASVTHDVSHEIKPEVLADNMVFETRLNIRSTLLETSAPVEQYPAIAREQEHVIRVEVERFFSTCYRQGYDPLALRDQLEPSLLQGERWRDVFKNAGYNVTVQCELDRKGAASAKS